jgi:sugar-specific transcriptional regulator TrmB
LTNCQAKAYLAAVQGGIGSATKISKDAMIARPDIYRVITSLENLGLIEKTLNKPTLIKAIPLSDGITFLIKRKKQETLKTFEESRNLIEFFKNCPNKNGAKENEHKFIHIPEKETYIRKRREEISNSQTSIDFITSWKRFPLKIYTFAESTKNALKRNVKIRVILEKPPNEHSVSKTIQEFEKNPNYQLKYTHNPPLAIIAIFDSKRAIIDMSSSAGLAEVPAIWTNNQCFLSIVSDYFENTWKTAIKHVPEQITQ